MKAEVNIRYVFRLPDGRVCSDCFCNHLRLRDDRVYFVPCSFRDGFLALDAPCDFIEGLLTHTPPDDIVSCHVQLFVEGMTDVIELPVAVDMAKSVATKFIAAVLPWVAEASSPAVAAAYPGTQKSQG
jgi:hypothetical protein